MPEQFTRREINRALLVGALAVLVPGARIHAACTPTPLFDFAITGGGYHGLDTVRDTIASGERLMLRAEPENPHDGDAIAVHRCEGLMLGYIPREANGPIASLLRRNAQIEAVVVEFLRFRRSVDIPDDFAFTGFADGDPRVRLTLVG